MQRIESGHSFARYRLGDLEVIALRDGYIDMPPSRLRQLGDEPFAAQRTGTSTSQEPISTPPVSAR
ncbi:hypothetical protein ACQP25_35355 [Microtetraspora malaysiensis]|uniref:hypothetical protein n=1 Tax=Microtetraspora malaysiensis TaxID=161358 RepID=UPI003D920023